MWNFRTRSGGGGRLAADASSLYSSGKAGPRGSSVDDAADLGGNRGAVFPRAPPPFTELVSPPGPARYRRLFCLTEGPWL
jgi:hypothetical protein